MPCIFPFIHNNVISYSCLKEEQKSPWCPTKLDPVGNYMEDDWGYCDMDTCETSGSGVLLRNPGTWKAQALDAKAASNLQPVWSIDESLMSYPSHFFQSEPAAAHGQTWLQVNFGQIYHIEAVVALVHYPEESAQKLANQEVILEEPNEHICSALQGTSRPASQHWVFECGNATNSDIPASVAIIRSWSHGQISIHDIQLRVKSEDMTASYRRKQHTYNELLPFTHTCIYMHVGVKQCIFSSFQLKIQFFPAVWSYMQRDSELKATTGLTLPTEVNRS
jgi:hypothetical protein